MTALYYRFPRRPHFTSTYYCTTTFTRIQFGAILLHQRPQTNWWYTAPFRCYITAPSRALSLRQAGGTWPRQLSVLEVNGVSLGVIALTDVVSTVEPVSPVYLGVIALTNVVSTVEPVCPVSLGVVVWTEVVPTVEPVSPVSLGVEPVSPVSLGVVVLTEVVPTVKPVSPVSLGVVALTDGRWSQ